MLSQCIFKRKVIVFSFSWRFLLNLSSKNKMVLEPNVSPHKQIIKDDDVKECISIKYVENQKVSFFTFTIM